MLTVETALGIEGRFQQPIKLSRSFAENDSSMKMDTTIPLWADELCWQQKPPSELKGGLQVNQNYITKSGSTSLLCAGAQIPYQKGEIMPFASTNCRCLARHLHRSLNKLSMPCLLFASTGLRELSKQTGSFLLVKSRFAFVFFLGCTSFFDASRCNAQ